MKKSLLSILMAVILVIAIPAAAMASPLNSLSSDNANGKTGLDTVMSVMAIGRDVTQGYTIFNGQMVGEITGTAYYAGLVTSATSILPIDTPIVAVEQLTYYVDGEGNILFGQVAGTITINAKFVDYTTKDFTIVDLSP